MHMPEDDHIIHLLQSSVPSTTSTDAATVAVAPTAAGVAEDGYLTLPQLRERALHLSVFAGLGQLKELSLAGM